MRRAALLLGCLWLASSAPLWGRERLAGLCGIGGKVVVTAGVQSTTKVEQTFPGATVTVFISGTLTPASIYSDNNGTVKANPFTADAATSAFFAYADDGRYDVQCSGAGISGAITFADIRLLDGSLAAVSTYTYTALAFSATPVFSATVPTIYAMTLTGNVTSSTVTGAVQGQSLIFQLCQDGTGGRTFAWPAGFVAAPAINRAASACTNTGFVYDGANWKQVGATANSLALPNQTVTLANGLNLTLPTAPDTVVGRASTDTLLAKTLTLAKLTEYTVATLPAAGAAGRLAVITDGSTSSTCTSGSGANVVLCRDTGAAWAPLSGAGGATSFNVNGAPVPAVQNFGALPAAGAGFINCIFAVTASNISLGCPTGTTSSTFAAGAGAAYVAKGGDTMTGLLVLSGDPGVANGAATKNYVDVLGAAKADLTAGKVPTSELGAGTADSYVALFGDQQYRVPTLASWVDVTDPAYGAIGDALQNNRGSFTASSTTVTVSTAGGRAGFTAGRDETKAITVGTSELPFAPVLAGAAVVNGAGCPASAGTLGNATLDSEFFWTLYYWNSTGSRYGWASHEGTIRVSAGTGTNNCIQLTTPAAVPVGYGAAASYDKWAIRLVGGTVDLTTAWPGKLSGTQFTANSVQTCANGSTTTPSVGTDCFVNSVSAGAGLAPARKGAVFTGTIVSVTNATNAVVSGNIAAWASSCPTGPCQMVTWGTDNAPGSAVKAQLALNHCTTLAAFPLSHGCTIYFPGPSARAGTTGSYLISHALTYPGPQNAAAYLHMTGAGATGSVTFIQDNGQSAMGTSQLLTIGTDPALIIGTNNCCGSNQINAGPEIDHLGFKDGSGAGLSDGAIKLWDVSSAEIHHVAFGDFFNPAQETLANGMVVDKGYGIRADTGWTTGTTGCAGDPPAFNNFDRFYNIMSVGTQNPIQSVNCKQSELRMFHLTFHSPQYGGGKCINIDGGYPLTENTNSGGNNTITESSCQYFPVSYYLKDQNTGKLDFARGEQSSAEEPNIIGSAQTGTQAVLNNIDPSKNFCNGIKVLWPTATSYKVALWVAKGCLGTRVDGFVVAGNTTEIVDNGTATYGFVNGEIYCQDPACAPRASKTLLAAATPYTNATTSFTNVPGLSFAVLASKTYKVACDLTYQGSASTAGLRVQFTGPGTPSVVGVRYFQPLTVNTTENHAASAFGSPLGGTTAITATTDFPAYVELSFTNGVNPGTVQLQAAAAGAGTVTIQPASGCAVQ